MKINDAKLLDYIENNLSAEEKSEFEKAIASNPELKKKVTDIEEAIKISSMAYEQEKESDIINFSSLKSRIDQEVDNEYKTITSSKKKVKSQL